MRIRLCTTRREVVAVSNSRNDGVTADRRVGVPAARPTDIALGASALHEAPDEGEQSCLVVAICLEDSKPVRSPDSSLDTHGDSSSPIPAAAVQVCRLAERRQNGYSVRTQACELTRAIGAANLLTLTSCAGIRRAMTRGIGKVELRAESARARAQSNLHPATHVLAKSPRTPPRTDGTDGSGRRADCRKARRLD
jgi:hypothetical protein